MIAKLESFEVPARHHHSIKDFMHETANFIKVADSYFTWYEVDGSAPPDDVFVLLLLLMPIK